VKTQSICWDWVFSKVFGGQRRREDLRSRILPSVRRV
jgi:hypothetical protein